ncbi:MAG: GDP-mannose 4,6-dehydratase [Elusimicrobiaceae bacterium]|nr:GDP-mannose 4,6-dehydratase [Elusimicrobiaceae bacterium]
MKKNNSTFLITGGAGFIGSHLAAFLLRQGHGVVVYDNLSSGKTENLAAIQDKITFIKGDILDFPSLKKSLAGIDGIFHLAALVSVPLSVQEPALTQKINVEGTLNVLKAACE